MKPRYTTEDLQHFHKTLDQKIEDQQKNPGADILEIHQMKKRKLHLKDLIEEKLRKPL